MAGTSPAMTNPYSDLRLPVRIGIDQATPARAIERLPRTFALREAIGHRIDDSRIMAHAAMAAFDLNAFGDGRRLFHAALPGADPVGAAEDGGGRHRRRLGERNAEARIFLVGAAAACPFIDAAGIGRARWTCERAAERDHAAHALRHHLGELARIEAAEAPANQRDLAAMGVVHLLEQISQPVLHTRAQAEIAALLPTTHRIAAIAQESAERPRRHVG